MVVEDGEDEAAKLVRPGGEARRQFSLLLPLAQHLPEEMGIAEIARAQFLISLHAEFGVPPTEDHHFALGEPLEEEFHVLGGQILPPVEISRLEPPLAELIEIPAKRSPAILLLVHLPH